MNRPGSALWKYTSRVLPARTPRALAEPSMTEDRAAWLAADLALRLADEAIVGLAQAGIVCAPLKGVLLLARWSELRGHRDLADVDLLVTREDFARAERRLRELGFDPTSRTNRGVTLARDDWPLSIDLHHRLFGPRLFEMPTTGLIARAERDETSFAAPVMRLADMDFLAHVVGHAVKSRLRPDDEFVLGDVAWLLRKLPIDPETCAAHIESLQMRRAAGYVFGAAASKGEPVAREILRHLHLDARDRAAIRAANAFPHRYWTPHLLNGSVGRGARSLSVQLRQDLGRRARRWLPSMAGA